MRPIVALWRLSDGAQPPPPGQLAEWPGIPLRFQADCHDIAGANLF
jgi:hypothetical protein